MDKRPDRLFVLLSAQTPLAHGDPGADTDSNIVPFRMDPVFSRRPAEERKDEVGNLSQPLNVAEEAIRMLAARYPLPPGSPLTASLQGLAAEDFLACAFTYSLISQLTGRNKGEGEGLFTGPSRYDMLLKRLALASSPFNPTFFDVYASLLRDLRVESHLDGFVDLLGYYAALPAGIQQAAIAKLGKNRQSVVLIARAWYNATKGEASQQRLLENVYYDPTGKVAGSSTRYVEALVPTISSNSFRHSIFRATLCDHLFSELGLGSVAQAQEEKLIPPFVAMMLSNAGNINAKVKVPSYTEAITAAAQKLFPSIELLGVTFPTHMTKSALSVANWTLCLQNNADTEPYGYTSDIDAAALLNITTHTRQVPDGMERSKENGQMIFSHTVTKQGEGVQILLCLDFEDHISDLARGAAYFALGRWLEKGGRIGGHLATGEGRLLLRDLYAGPFPRDEGVSRQALEYLQRCADDYAAYVIEHRDILRDALCSGTLGWKERLPA